MTERYRFGGHTPESVKRMKAAADRVRGVVDRISKEKSDEVQAGHSPL